MKLPIVLVPHPHVRVDVNVLGGSPHVVGSRVPVRRLWAFYRGGASVDKILKRFPQLGAAKVFDSLAFALDNPEVMEADIRQEQELLELAGHTARKKVTNDSQMELPFAGDMQSEPLPLFPPAAVSKSEVRTNSETGDRPSNTRSSKPKKPISER
jgi:uncharacterized protein (DUF433 family)